jgi:hypothetical protein
MMCLGWANRYECAARVPLELTPSGGVSVGTAGTSAASALANGYSTSSLTSPCGSALWFWIAGAVIVAGGVFKGK